jgi:hypothetical protein
MTLVESTKFCRDFRSDLGSTKIRGIPVIVYSSNMIGRWPESAGPIRFRICRKMLRHLDITGSSGRSQEPPFAKPLVAGSSPARPTSEGIFSKFGG